MPTPHVETVKIDELDCWRIRHNGAELMVAQQGAHIFSYQREGEQPLIWPNPEAVFKQGKGIRTGVPVCWPWFGVFDRNPQSVKAMRQSDQPAGAHGFVRTGLWGIMRHPNYMAEQSIWVCFYLFSVACTGEWINGSIAGSLLLLILFRSSSDFSEEISAEKYPEYKEYQQKVPRFLPIKLW